MTNQERYASHWWKSERQMTDYGTGYEYICVCDECGCENMGDPAEVPQIEYPVCGDTVLIKIGQVLTDGRPIIE